MNQKQALQQAVDMLAHKYVPALRGAKVIRFDHQYEIWVQGTHDESGMPQLKCMAVGSYSYCLMYLGCVALLGRVQPFNTVPPLIFTLVCDSAAKAGVL